MTYTAIPRFEGKSADYQFFRNVETGATFKVKVAATSAAIGALGANTQFGVCFTTSQVDTSGKAMREDGLPVIDSWTHTFTDVETSAEGFSLEARLKVILLERLAALEARHTARSSLTQMQVAWADQPIIL